MDALLMHKEIPVVDIVFDEESSVILGIGTTLFLYFSNYILSDLYSTF